MSGIISGTKAWLRCINIKDRGDFSYGIGSNPGSDERGRRHTQQLDCLCAATPESSCRHSWLDFGALAGGLLFAFMAPIMIPHNYQSGVFSAVLSTLVLGIVLYVCLGSIWAMVTDILRVRDPEKYVIIITPEDFVKQEGKKIIHVPLEYVRYVTARGAPPPIDRSAETAAAEARPGGVGEGIASLFLGRRVAAGARQGGFGRRRMRTPTTLAFIDSRTDKEVIVVTDKAYGDPHYIAEKS